MSTAPCPIRSSFLFSRHPLSCSYLEVPNQNLSSPPSFIINNESNNFNAKPLSKTTHFHFHRCYPKNTKVRKIPIRRIRVFSSPFFTTANHFAAIPFNLWRFCTIGSSIHTDCRIASQLYTKIPK